jgi:hypothetical protein
MKVKCIRLLNSDGKEVEFSPWLTLGGVYHVLSMFIDQNGKRSYGIVTPHRKENWPSIGSFSEDCFEIVSDVVPSNWRTVTYDNNAKDISPAAWQEPGFYGGFSECDPAMYPIFERERDIILSEDP